MLIKEACNMVLPVTWWIVINLNGQSLHPTKSKSVDINSELLSVF